MAISQVPGVENDIDCATEAAWRIASTQPAGRKMEIFNLTDNEEKQLL